MSDLYQARQQYDKARSYEQDMLDEPMAQFAQWFEKALTQEPHEAYAMNLATVDAKGHPHVRVVLMRHHSDKGIVFFSHYGSAKGVDLLHQPYAELMFYWPTQQQQVRMSGLVRRIDEKESIHYFSQRPRDSQIAAHVSAPQSGIVSSRDEMDFQFERLSQQWLNQEIPKPESWGGYMLSPESVEFWQGGVNRMHDRIQYRRDQQQWHKIRLLP